jgi:hypothetical protein
MSRENERQHSFTDNDCSPSLSSPCGRSLVCRRPCFAHDGDAAVSGAFAAAADRRFAIIGAMVIPMTDLRGRRLTFVQ